MALLHHYNTIRLGTDQYGKEVSITELSGFKVTDEDRKKLYELERHNALISSEKDSKKHTEFDNIRLAISAKADRKEYRHYSSHELENLTDQFLAANAHDSTSYDWEAENRATHHRAAMIQQDYDLVLSIARQLIADQQSYLCSRDWMDKRKVTYLKIAAQHPQYSEPTIRRRVQLLKFRLNDWRFSATELLCANDLPYLCKQITRLLKSHPHAGRPTLYRLLHDEGYGFSDRHIGNAMKLLQRVRYYDDTQY